MVSNLDVRVRGVYLPGACVSDHSQYYSSCKTGNMDQALSIWFLLLWLGGDVCNLVGSFLADQLPLQVGAVIVYA